MRKIIIFSGIIWFFSVSLCFAQEESFTITTYYPSPYGSYNELQTNKMAIGDTNGDGQLTSADQPANNGYLLVAERVGIGTANPATNLDVNGQIRIRGGNPLADRVLTSDANGLATWQNNRLGGYQIVFKNCGRASGALACSVDCPAGKRVMGGGCRTDVGWYVRQTYPSSQSTWMCIVSGFGSNWAEAYAVCAY